MAIELLAVIPAGAVHAQTTSTIKVRTNNGSFDNVITGYYVTFWQGGNQIDSCYSTCADTVENGIVYQVAVADYGDCTFRNWETPGTSDYSTNRFYTIDFTSTTSSTSIQLDAYYNCGTPTTSGSLTVQSQDQNLSPISGYYTVLYDQNGDTAGTGFTPDTFSGLTSGQSYSVQVDDYGSCAFTQWSDGITVNPRPFYPTSSGMTFTADYNCGGGGGGSGTSTISVSTVNSQGSAITGYYIELWQNGAQINICFSPCSFTVNNGQAYQLIADSYGSETFDHWLNDGSTGAETVNLPASSTTISLTAVYNP